MTTDTMRQKFEAWIKSVFGDYVNLSPRVSNCGVMSHGWEYQHETVEKMRVSFEYAYALGKRDLIEAMGEPVAYHGKSESHEGITSDQRIVQLWGGFNHIVIAPLYKLPRKA